MAKFIIEVDLDDAPTVRAAVDACSQMLLAFSKSAPPGGSLRRLLTNHASDEGRVILFEAIDEDRAIADGTVAARAVLVEAPFDRAVLARAQAERSGTGLTVVHADGRKEDAA